MKKKKDNIIHDIKIYNIIMSNVWKLITFLLIGVLGGFLFEHYSKYKDFNYMLFSIVLFAIIGIIDFFVSIVRDSKRLEKAEEKKKEKEEEKQSPPNSSSRHLSENVRKSDKYKSGTCIRLYIK